MTNPKQKQKIIYYTLFLATLAACTAILVAYIGLITTYELTAYAYTQRRDSVRSYAYNELVPVEVIKQEIVRQAEIYDVDPDKALKLAECESQFNNLAKNPNSTALGVYQYLIKTWEETQSFKKHRKARTDYKANIREAMLDIANGEVYKRWPECAGKAGF